MRTIDRNGIGESGTCNERRNSVWAIVEPPISENSGRQSQLINEQNERDAPQNVLQRAAEGVTNSDGPNSRTEPKTMSVLTAGDRWRVQRGTNSAILGWASCCDHRR